MEKKNKSSLLNRWKNSEKKTVVGNPITKAPEGINIPLSSGQKRLWFLQQLYPKNPFYNYSETYTFSGKLNINFLIKSLEMVYQDHDVLKTKYKIQDNTLIQQIDEHAQIKINTHDLSVINEKDASQKSIGIMKADATKHFDLSKSPLVRASIIKLKENKHILQITLHHIGTDKWSMKIIREHLAGYYLELLQNKELTPRKTAIQYKDYCFWLEKKELNNNTLRYWKKKLAEPIPKLTLPFDFDRPLTPSFKGKASFTQDYSQELSKQILDLSKALETTPYNIMLAVFYIFLYKCSGQKDIAIGTPITNRDQKSLEDLVGFFNDTVVLRKQIDSKISFIDFAKKVHVNTLAAFANKDIPFDRLVKEMNITRSPSFNPFFQVMFLYHSKPENPSFGQNLIMSHTWYDSEVSKFDLTIYIGEDNGIFSSTFEYASDLFETSTINRFQHYFKIILESVVSNPNQIISDIQISSPNEQSLVLQKETLQTKIIYNKGIHNIVEDIALKYPSKSAVSYKNYTISYSELNTKANVIAKKIIDTGIKNNVVIGLCTERSTEMIVGLLGILKAGCSYLPIDPEYPNERIDFMLNDSKTELIITQSHLKNLFNENIQYINIDNIVISSTKIEFEFPYVKRDDLAYIIYTSGSTGKPKGVPVSHENIIQSTFGRLDYYENNPEAFLLMSSISFDSSKAGIFWTLCTGGNLVITPKRIEQNINDISLLINEHKITHTLMLPTLYNLILDYAETSKLNSLNTVIVAGEACNILLCEKHFKKFPDVNLYNEYGPTEATVWCIAHKITRKDLALKNVPIGRPVANAKVSILDNDLNHTPIGVHGEIFIGGPGLSKGYINRDDLTQKVFIIDPFNEKEILYKTGDLAKYKSDGNILFLGRVDEQIKIRGFRVELSEIENTIKSYSHDISEAIVLLEEDGKNEYLEFNNLSDETLLKFLKNLDEKELNTIFTSIKSLSEDEKNYLLNKI